jgi:hypothetical protein
MPRASEPVCVQRALVQRGTVVRATVAVRVELPVNTGKEHVLASNLDPLHLAVAQVVYAGNAFFHDPSSSRITVSA